MHKFRTATNSGKVIRNSDLQQIAKDIYSRQRALQIYNASGERIRTFSAVNEEDIKTIVYCSTTVIYCPACKLDVPDANDGIFNHMFLCVMGFVKVRDIKILNINTRRSHLSMSWKDV